jgi:hypothetical protein
MAKSIVKIVSFLLLSLLLSAGILLGIAYYWASAHKEQIPEQSRAWLYAEAGLLLHEKATFQINYWEYFPFLAVDVNEVQVESVDSCATPLFKAQKVHLLIHPARLFNSEIQIEHIYVDGGKVFIEKYKDGTTNLPTWSGSDGENTMHIHPLKVHLQNVELEYSNIDKQKHHQVLFRVGVVDFVPRDEQLAIQIQGNCFFHELLFKPHKGPYLKDAETILNLSLSVDHCNNKLDILPSTLAVNETTINIYGDLDTRERPWINLHIEAPSISLAQGLPILPTHLQSKLHRFKADKKFKVHALLNGLTGVEPIPLRVVFETQNARLAADNIEVTQANLKGVFDNQCLSHPTEIDTAKCLDLTLSKGLLFDKFPIEATIFNNGIVNTGIVADGHINMPLKTFNTYLPAHHAFFEDGHCSFPFTLKGDPALLFDRSADSLGVSLQAEALISNGLFRYLPNQLKCERISAKLKIEGRDMIVDHLLFMLKQDSFHFRGKVIDFLPMVLQKPHQLTTQLFLTSNALVLDSLIAQPTNKDQAFPVGSLQLVEDLSQHGQLNLHIETDTLQINKMSVHNARFNCELFNQCTLDGYQTASCLQISDFTGTAYDSIDLRVSLLATELRNPFIQMDMDVSAPLEQLNALMPKDKLLLTNGDLLIQIAYQGYLVDYTSLDTAILKGQVQGSSTLKGAAFQYHPNGFEFEEVNARLRFDEHHLYVDEISGNLNENAITADGFITDFIPFLVGHQNVMYANLLIQTPRLDFSTLQVQEHRNTDTTISFIPNVIGNAIDRTIQKIEGRFDVCADELLFRDFRMTKVSFQSTFFQHCNDQMEQPACVYIDSLSALLWGSAPFSAKVQVIGLNRPRFIADVAAELPLLELNRMFPPNQFTFLGGRLKTNFHYEGCPDEQFDMNTNILNAFFQGEAQLISADLNYKPRGFEFRQLDGSFVFDNKGLYLHNIATILNGNHLIAKGTMPNFMPFLLNPGQRLQAELTIESPHFSFDQFKAPQKFASNRKAKAIAPTQFTTVVDTALEQIIAKLKIRLDTVSYRQFRGEAINGTLTMRPDYLRFDEVNLDIANGHLALNGQISNLEKHQPEIDIRAKFKQADIQKVFYAFENFGQDQLQAHNIAGTLNADIMFRARGNANYDLLPESKSGSFHLEVMDGELIEFPALQAMSGALFKKRNMDHVRFANLKNTFTLDGQNLKIEYFYVVSNVLDFGLQGVYSIGSDEDTRLLFEVPVSNIFQRNLEIEHGYQDKGRWKMLPLLLEATKEDDGLELNYRLFRGSWKE